MVRTSTSNSEQAYSSTSVEHHECPKYKGVRKRKWGKWVSEIRLPNSRERIWLGSYDTPEKAARAFDAAQFCLRGPHAHFNFPGSPPDIAGGQSLSPQEIQVVAARFANDNIIDDSSCQEPNPSYPPESGESSHRGSSVINDHDHQQYYSFDASIDTTTIGGHHHQYHDHDLDISTMDWSLLNFLDYSNDHGGAYYDNFDPFPGLHDDKMHSGEFFAPVLPAAPDNNSTRGADQINGDEPFNSHDAHSSFLWNF
ncbi:AP2/ERF domain containing protein [Parasponia andersonii]|uniref:AP2/ERF domain containing protein n=1 Tax=Parasponia andersonii TaxID=3476 RepID=A0A2P5DIK9_PARAD|nr:AP2/ERF domain containing protein [Parasponia andersonii]